MLDCENRLEAARYFLKRANDDLDEAQHIWYLQASVIFAVAAVENLVYDYAEIKTHKPLKSKNLSRDDFQTSFPALKPFCTWLAKKETQSTLYNFLRSERNLIVHRGEPTKEIKLDIHQPLGSGKAEWTMNRYFKGWTAQPVGEACKILIDWVSDLIIEGKKLYPELV